MVSVSPRKLPIAATILIVVIASIAIQCSKEAAREEVLILQMKEDAIESINKELEAAYIEFVEAKSRLNDARSFQIFRSKASKNKEIESREKEVKQAEEKVIAIEARMKRVNPEWERPLNIN